MLCTINAIGLYSNIPHSEGLTSLRRVLELSDNKQISSDAILELAEIVPKNNIFQFDEKTFKQVRETAIGTKFAPPYAILFMAGLEEKILSASEKKAMIWWRYIDDIFFVWEHGEESLEKFLNKLNSFHSTIKFTAEYSKETINFLDVNIRLVGGELMTDLFVKPTDTHQFLDPSSSHPYHCKEGIPYSQALRLNRICSDNDSFDKRCNDLEGWLMERGYNGKMIRKQILRAREHSRKDLLEREKTETSEPNLTFNITYDSVFQNIRNILQELHLLLAPDKEHKKVFPDVPVVGFRNVKSLKDYLVRAALPKTNETGRCEPRGKKTCLVLNSIRTTTTFTTEACREIFKIQSGPLNCNSEKVLYHFKCKVCGEAPYVVTVVTVNCDNRGRIQINEFERHSLPLPFSFDW